METIGYVHSIESFGSVDGPGVRFVVFLQGCHMRCKYCHNPETWSTTGGKAYTAEELLKRAVRYRSYWGSNGGITVSGGEALLQMDFLIEFFTKAKAEGIHTTLDTSGNPFRELPEYLEKFEGLMEVTDLFMLDLKHMDDQKHRQLTGCSNQNILALAKYLSDKDKPMWIRHVLVPGYTDETEQLTALRAFTESLRTVELFEILPYHTLGTFKWEKLGITYPLEGVQPPTKEEILRAEKILGIKN